MHVVQLMMGLMMNEPKEGQPSYKQFAQEKADLLSSLKRKAHQVTDFFNSLEGMTCTFTEGAMYSFPQIRCAPTAALQGPVCGEPSCPTKTVGHLC